MERLSKEAEQRVFEALEKSIQLTNSGTSPNDAICKIASEYRFGAPMIRRMVEAYNVSKTLAHMKTASADKRAETFAIADPNAILEKLYPSKEKFAASLKAIVTDMDALPKNETNFVKGAKDYTLPDWKKPEAYGRDPEYQIGRWFAKRDHIKRAMENARLDVSEAHDKLTAALEKASAYFRIAGHEPFEYVEKRALWEYGTTVGSSLMNLIYDEAHLKEKRGEVSERPVVFDRGKEPYAAIASAASWAKTMTEKAATLIDLEAQFEKHGEARPKTAEESRPLLLDDVLTSSGGTPGPFELTIPPGTQFKKEALDIPSAIASKVVLDSVSGMFNAPDSEKAKLKAKDIIADPQQEVRLATPRVRSMLNDFLSNDEVLSTHPVESVVSAYNQLAQLAPIASQQPAVMRGLLRKMVQQGGVIEPFEAHQLGNIEKGLRGMKDTGE